LQKLDNLNDAVTEILATAQLLEDSARKDELPGSYLENLESIGNSSLAVADLIKQIGRETIQGDMTAKNRGSNVSNQKQLPDSWLKERQVEADPLTAEMAVSEELVDGIKSLVSQAFDNGNRHGLYLSASADENYQYYLIASNREMREELRNEAVTSEGWIACNRLSELPESIRSLDGDLNLRMSGEKLAGLIWRIPIAKAISGATGRLRILGIDDQEAIRELLNNIISALGHEVTTVSDSETALELMENDRFDLVIVEVALPGQSGWQVAERIKRLSPRTPVIMLSGWDYQESRVGTARQHADFVLTKPFKMEQLRQAIVDAAALISG
jgi:CheY-like chemotaxis protein